MGGAGAEQLADVACRRGRAGAAAVVSPALCGPKPVGVWPVAPDVRSTHCPPVGAPPCKSDRRMAPSPGFGFASAGLSHKGERRVDSLSPGGRGGGGRRQRRRPNRVRGILPAALASRPHKKVHQKAGFSEFPPHPACCAGRPLPQRGEAYWTAACAGRTHGGRSKEVWIPACAGMTRCPLTRPAAQAGLSRKGERRVDSLSRQGGGVCLPLLAGLCSAGLLPRPAFPSIDLRKS